MPRKLKNWVEQYISLIAPSSESPLAYIFWSAATTVSTVMKRNCYVGRGTYKLYPNLYTVLVGRPGIGKGTAIKPAINLMKEAKVANTLSGRITIEYVLERMATGWPAPMLGGSMKIGNESNCMIYSTELSVFLSASPNTLPILCDIWDFDEGEFDYGTRHKGEFKIKNPCLTLLGGSTQEWLISSIPSSAVGGGFTRRVNFVVANDREKLLPWPVVQNHSSIRDGLIMDLQAISRLRGEFHFASDVRPLFEACYSKDSNPTEYDDEATTSYKTSLWAQVVKLAMCMSAARGDDMIINKDDFRKAYDAIMIVADNVTKVFRGVGESEMAIVTDKVLRFLESKGMANRQEILRSLWRDVTHEDLDKILATLLTGAVIYEVQQGRNTMYAVKATHTVGQPTTRKIRGVTI
jgi:hypothetical protein